jgi:hypothetical protein
MNKNKSKGIINKKGMIEDAEANLAKRIPNVKKKENLTIAKFTNFIQLI